MAVTETVNEHETAPRAVNTSRVMGVVLFLLGLSLAIAVGAAGEPAALVLGVVASTALFYMGIGLVARGDTAEGVLRSAPADDRERSLTRTAAAVATVAAVGALLGYGVATARGLGAVPRAAFAVLFLVDLPAAALLWRRSRATEEDDGSDDSAPAGADAEAAPDAGDGAETEDAGDVDDT